MRVCINPSKILSEAVFKRYKLYDVISLEYYDNYSYNYQEGNRIIPPLNIKYNVKIINEFGKLTSVNSIYLMTAEDTRKIVINEILE